MTRKIKKVDIEKIPSQVLGTYLMHEKGINPRKHIAENTFYKHKKILLEYGVDISNQTVKRIKQPTVIIQPTPFVLDEDQLLEG